MGLDMYLYAEKHISAYDIEYGSDGLTRRDNIEYDNVLEAGKMLGLPSGDFGGVMVTKQVAYWRKANAIHGWIVRNCADGVDECQRIYMSRGDLIRLRDKCLEALTNRNNAVPNVSSTINLKEEAEDVTSEIMATIKAESSKVNRKYGAISDPLSLEPVDGFFFGGTEKDEWYYDSIEYTLDTLNSLLASDMELDFYYRASW